LKCKKKAAINLSVDCRFFSVIAENLELRKWGYRWRIRRMVRYRER
jgi:hypothetical protein